MPTTATPLPFDAPTPAQAFTALRSQSMQRKPSGRLDDVIANARANLREAREINAWLDEDLRVGLNGDAGESSL